MRQHGTRSSRRSSITERVPVDIRILGPGIDWASDPRFPAIAALKFGAQTLTCSRIAIDAELASKESARLHIWECPATPWRTTRMELRVGERLLWGFGRVALQQTGGQ